MKIYFDNVDFTSRSGPNTFGLRIAKQLLLLGHTLADHDDYDIAIVFIHPTYKLNTKKPYILRLDGIWTKPEEFVTHNAAIKLHYHNANSVIIQSEFDKQFIEKHWGIRKNSFIVGNGIDFIDIENAKKQVSTQDGISLQPLLNNYDTIYVCSSNWHPQKRLNDNYRLFAHIRQNINPNSCLVVMGANAHSSDIKDIKPHVFYAGNLEHDKCLQIYLQCNWMLHLAYADHFPNTVVESVACGTPVICSNIGGTKEIITTQFGNYGHVIYDGEFAYEPFDYDTPPNIDISSLKSIKLPINEIHTCILEKIDIINVAKQYEQILQSLI